MSIDITKLKVGDRIVYTSSTHGSKGEREHCKKYLKLDETYIC